MNNKIMLTGCTKDAINQQIDDAIQRLLTVPTDLIVANSTFMNSFDNFSQDLVQDIKIQKAKKNMPVDVGMYEIDGDTVYVVFDAFGSKHEEYSSVGSFKMNMPAYSRWVSDNPPVELEGIEWELTEDDEYISDRRSHVTFTPNIGKLISDIDTLPTFLVNAYEHSNIKTR